MNNRVLIVLILMALVGCEELKLTLPFATPATVKFEKTKVGQLNTAEVLVTNPSTLPMHVISLESDSEEFEVTAGDCADTLSPGDECPISITFSPAADGERSAAITLGYCLSEEACNERSLWIPISVSGAAEFETEYLVNIDSDLTSHNQVLDFYVPQYAGSPERVVGATLEVNFGGTTSAAYMSIVTSMYQEALLRINGQETGASVVANPQPFRRLGSTWQDFTWNYDFTIWFSRSLQLTEVSGLLGDGMNHLELISYIAYGSPAIAPKNVNGHWSGTIRLKYLIAD